MGINKPISKEVSYSSSDAFVSFYQGFVYMCKKTENILFSCVKDAGIPEICPHVVSAKISININNCIFAPD
jgi:hypothetical protein